MKRVQQAFEKSGKTLEEVGQAMGAEKTPRQSAWQFIYKTADPRLSMLRRFAKAVGVPVEDLVTEKRKG